jgi:hypothetical protein
MSIGMLALCGVEVVPEVPEAGVDPESPEPPPHAASNMVAMLRDKKRFPVESMNYSCLTINNLLFRARSRRRALDVSTNE